MDHGAELTPCGVCGAEMGKLEKKKKNRCLVNRHRERERDWVWHVSGRKPCGSVSMAVASGRRGLVVLDDDEE